MRNQSKASLATASTRRTPCCSKVGLKRGPWTTEEDELLANYIKREGEGRWRMLPKHAGLLRCGKSCRLRWMNYLRPSVKRGQIGDDEEDLILRLHRLLGNRWALIAGRIPGRTDNEIKNYWNTHLSKKLISQGIDPRTHKPLNPNPNPNPNSSRVVYCKAQHPSPCPNTNPNPNFSGLEQTGRGFNRFAFSKNSEESKVSSLNQCQNGSVENWQNCDGLMRELHGKYSNEEDDIRYCNDDTFSSFLNSLINEEDFANQQHQHPNMTAPSSSIQTFDHGTAVWEAALASTMASLGDEQNGLKNQYMA